MSPVVLKVRAAAEREKSRTAALQQQVRRSARHCSDAERDLAQTKQVVAALRKPTAKDPDASLPVVNSAELSRTLCPLSRTLCPPHHSRLVAVGCVAFRVSVRTGTSSSRSSLDSQGSPTASEEDSEAAAEERSMHGRLFIYTRKPGDWLSHPFVSRC